MKKYVGLGLISFFIYQNVWADFWQDFWNGTTFYGYIRQYDFIRDYSNPTISNQDAFSLGGSLGVLTAPVLTGFQLGATYYTAQSFGINSNKPSEVDETLPGHALSNLGQAFLQYSGQYEGAKYLIRGGDQIVNTPWVNDADTRMVPATYQGAYGTFSPTSSLEITGLRLIAYKSRTVNPFTQTNLYNPSNGGTLTQLGNTTNPGVAAGGIHYKPEAIDTQLWYYQFYDFAKLFYTDFSYTFRKKETVRPIVGVQFLREWSDGNLLQQVAGGVAHAMDYGAMAGLDIGDNFNVTAGYDDIPSYSGAFKNGDIVSPYTVGYTSDPLYTTSMIAGLIEKAIGHAMKGAATYYAFDHHLRFILSDAEYYTAPALPNTNEADFDVTYLPQGKLKGLSLRNRVGIEKGVVNFHQFIYERVMLQYSF
jgi:hypothetical protein